MDLYVQLTSRESQVVNFVSGFPMVPTFSFGVSDHIFIMLYNTVATGCYIGNLTQFAQLNKEEAAKSTCFQKLKVWNPPAQSRSVP
jgi:hypothetical protein